MIYNNGMDDNPLQTKPLENKLTLLDWDIELTPDGLGLIVTAPAGKRLSMTDARFVVSEKGRRLEVRCK